MAPSKPFASMSRIIDERFEAKAMDIHHRHLEAAKAIVDTSQPQFMHSLEKNGKKAEQEAEKLFQIETENVRMYQRLASIEDFDSSKVLRPSTVRTSLSSAKPGMFYAGIGGHQCVDHINLTAMSNPRSLHYRGPGAAHLSHSRTGSLAGNDPMFSQGAEADEALRVQRSSGSDCETSFIPTGRSQSVTSAGSSREARPKAAGVPHGLHGVGSPYLAAPVALPPRASAVGPQPWSGQLTRRRETGDFSDLGSGMDASMFNTPRRCTIDADEPGLPHIPAPGSRRGSRDGELAASADFLTARGSGAVGGGGVAPHHHGGVVTRSADALLSAVPPHLPLPPRGGTPVKRPGGGGGGPDFSSFSANCTPRKASSRGPSPMRNRSRTVDPYGTPLRGPSPAGSRDASPMRLLNDGDGTGSFHRGTSSECDPSQMSSHMARKEILKSTYLVGAHVQLKGNTIMATRRSISDVQALASTSAHTSPFKYEH